MDFGVSWGIKVDCLLRFEGSRADGNYIRGGGGDETDGSRGHSSVAKKFRKKLRCRDAEG